MHLFPFFRQIKGNGCRDSGFPHTAFSHGEDHLAVMGGDVVDHIRQLVQMGNVNRLLCSCRVIAPQHRADVVDPRDVVSAHRDLSGVHVPQSFRHFRKGPLLFVVQRFRYRIAAFFRDGVHDEHLPVEAQLPQFAGRPGRFLQRGFFRPRDQHQCRLLRIRQCCHRLLIHLLLFVQA